MGKPHALAKTDAGAPYDVIVVGAGAAGLAAAVTATEAGVASVLVIDASHFPGGSSRLSGAIVMAAETHAQKAAGIVDSIDDMYRDFMALSGWQPIPALARQLVEQSGLAIAWLENLGVEFHRKVLIDDATRPPRGHAPKGGGEAVISRLVAVAEERGVHFLPDRRVDELLIEDGRVCGIQARGVNYYGHAVVLATGGFGANKELLAQYFPEALSAGDWQYYIGTEDAQGDALGLGEQVGAQIVEGGGLRMLYANLVKVHPRYDVQIPGWLLMVDSQGRRFVDEMIHYSVMDGTVRAIGDRLWAILDEAAVEAAAPDKPAEVKDPNGKPSPVWNSRVLHAAAAEGKIERADTVADLARQVGLPPEQLEGTIERYNESAALGFDRDYSKSAEFVRALRKPPFYAVEIRPAGVCITFTGLRIDIDAAVLDQASRPIPGLYAAGECTGGVVRDVYSGSGCSYANCLVYGRIAGREAAHTAGSDTLATEAVR